MFTVLPRQSTNMFFKIVPYTEQDANHNERRNTHFNFPPKKEENGFPQNCPVLDFLNREKFFMTEKVAPDIFASSFSPKEKVEEIPTSSLMDFLIIWEAKTEMNQRICFGQHTICNIAFLTTSTAEQSVSENNALRYSVEAPRKVLHEFTKESTCIVPVVFHLSNRSTTAPLSFYLETLRPHDQIETVPHRSGSISQQKRSQYFWSGVTQHYVSDLLPGQKIEIETLACFTRPGVYNLNRYKFSIKDSRKRQVVQQIYSQFQHLIMVEDQNEQGSGTETVPEDLEKSTT